MLALFGRAALRDFVDVASVSQPFGHDELLRVAGEIDEGFDLAVFTEMLDTLNRFTDDEITEFADPSVLRGFFTVWAQELRQDAAGSG